MSWLSSINNRIARHRLALLLLLALLLRLLLWNQPLHQLANDEIEYMTVARDLLAGRGWHFYEHYRWLRAPLYSLFLAASLWLAQGDLHRAALPNIALSVANVYLIYRLALALVGARAAQFAALLAALLWTFVTFASLYMSETLFAFLFTGSLVCLMQETTADRRSRMEDRGWRMAALRFSILHPPSSILTGHWPAITGGALFGLATLTRSITLLFLPIVALWLLLRPTTNDQRPTTDDQGDKETRRQGDREHATGNELQAMGNRQRTTLVRSPDTRHPAPDTRRSILHPPSSILYPRWLAAGWFVLATALVIAPWTLRNQLAYGRPILVETGLSFNVWFFSEPRENNDEIYAALESIPNPAERSDYATAKGMARLREDPTIVLRKLWPSWTSLWQVKPIEDRFIMESYYADAGLPLFAGALIFDDALYLVIALAAIAGLVLYKAPAARRWAATALQPLPAGVASPKTLVIVWVLYVVATVVFTHGEGRYRHLLFPVLIPYAAWALASRGAPREPARWRAALSTPRRAASLLVIAALWALFLRATLPAYPWPWAAANLARGWHATVGDIAWALGQRAAALRAYGRALDAEKTPDGWLRIGDAARAMGDLPLALRAYRNAVHKTPPYIAASARLGDLLRQLGDDADAREAFEGEYADQQQMVDWAWRNLRPAPKSYLDIGDGLDFGYVGGVYTAEEQQDAMARWTDGRAIIRLSRRTADQAGDGAAHSLVRLRLAAPRPDQAAVPVEVCAEERCSTLEVGPVWRNYLVLFSSRGAQPLNIEIRSATFRPRDHDPSSTDDRTLGVMVSQAAIISP
jgi:hypothetical protein